MYTEEKNKEDIYIKLFYRNFSKDNIEIKRIY